MLVISALQTLPTALALLATFMVYEVRWSQEAAVMFGQLGVTLLQIVAGVAIMWRRYARIACGAYAIVMVAVIVFAFAWMPDLEGARAQIAVVIEMIGPPLIVVVVPWLFGVRPTGSPANAAGGVLIALAFSTFLTVPVSLVESVRLVDAARLAAVSRMSISYLVPLAIATCALIAGLRLIAGRPARTAMLVYLIVAIVARVALEVVTMISISMSMSMESRILDRVIAQRAPFMISAIAIPVVLWAYVKPELQQRSTARGDLALVWGALWLAPLLAARCLVLPDLQPVTGTAPVVVAVACCALLAVLFALAAVPALRDQRAPLLWLGAAGVAAVLFVMTVYVTWDLDRLTANQLKSLVRLDAILIVIPATIAWLWRRRPTQSLDDVFD